MIEDIVDADQMDDLTADVAVIGAGTAGLAAERAARKAGATTLLIDNGFSGTTCAQVGCMPSKLLIAAAEAAHNAKRAFIFGIACPVKIDGVAVMSRVRKERDAFVEATLKSINDIPPDIHIDARARFAGPKDLELSDGRRVTAKTVVIATGARPSLPDPFKGLGDRILTNETVFELDDLPGSLAVVGAGPLGLELAQAFARLGVDTHVFGSSDHLAALRDAQVADEVRSVLSEEFTLHPGIKLDASKGSQCIHLTWAGPSSGSRTFDYVLVAAGRPAAFDGLALDVTSLERDEKAFPASTRIPFNVVTHRFSSQATLMVPDRCCMRPHSRAIWPGAMRRVSRTSNDISEWSRWPSCSRIPRLQ